MQIEQLIIPTNLPIVCWVEKFLIYARGVKESLLAKIFERHCDDEAIEAWAELMEISLLELEKNSFSKEDEPEPGKA